MLSAVVEVSGAVFGYSGVPVTRPLTFGVGAGEVVAIVGPSGCGKTTALRAIAGALPLLQGALRIDDGERSPEWLSRHTARTLQNFPLFHWLTVEGNLRLAARVQGAADVDFDKLLAEFSALHLRDKNPMTLSGGERCRASLCQAALTKPRVLLLDEPFSGLDLKVKADIARHVFSFSRQQHVSTILVTHDLLDAVDFADRIVVLKTISGLAEIAATVNANAPDAIQIVRRHLLNGSGEQAA